MSNPKPVSFRSLQDDKVVKRADSQKAKVQDFHIVEGFNGRFKTLDYLAKVDELAQKIKNGLQVGPVEVAPAAGGVEVVDGHTRILAHKQLFEAGEHPDTDKNGELWLEFFPTKAKTLLEKYARIVETQDNRKLDSLELAFNYTRMRDEPVSRGLKPLTMEEIAKIVRKTRAHVEQMLKLETADNELKSMVMRGEVTSTIAVELVRQHGSDATDVARSELKNAQSMGKKKITAATLSAKKPPRHILEEIATHYEEIAKAWTKEDRVKLVEYQKGISADESVTVQMPVGRVLALQMAFEELQRIKDDLESKRKIQEQKETQEEAEV